MEANAPEGSLIIIPSADWKIVEAVREHYADAKALLRVNEIDDRLNILDKDSLDNVKRVAEQELAIADALAKVLEARCPRCVQSYTKKERVMSFYEIVEGQCQECKAKIVQEA